MKIVIMMMIIKKLFDILISRSKINGVGDMPVVTLVKNAKQYRGQYVTTKSFQDKEVITHGKDPVKVIEEAKKKGIKEPVIIYVPEKEVAHLY